MNYKAGDTLCSCTLLQKCGDGSYGEVWLAHDAIGARVAVKIIRDGEKYAGQELKGLKNYRDCNHPNLLKIRHVEITGSQIFYTMDAADDLNDGKGEYQPDTLARRLNKCGRLDGREISVMVEELLCGLEELHRQGLIHRDIKPDNIIRVNGRYTLADVGLIACDGAGTLVGTPGFLSPQVLEGKKAEPSDDFYALGKVIYCALTGLPVSEYPSLPPDLTISLDANLNRALRESCSHPVNSATEFRALLQGKKLAHPVPKKAAGQSFPFKKLLYALILLILAGGFIYLFIQQKKMEQKHIVQPVKMDIAGEMKLARLQNIDEEFRQVLQNDVQTYLKESGHLDNEKFLQSLLTYQIMSGQKKREVLIRAVPGTRLHPAEIPAKPSFDRLKQGAVLFSMFVSGYPDFAEHKVLERQSHWQSQSNLRNMLTTDPIMQALALDSTIRDKVNAILQTDSLSEMEKAELQKLLELRHFLLDPEWGKIQYQAKMFTPSS